MVSAMTSALEVTINTSDKRMDLNVNKLTATVTSALSFNNNLGKDTHDHPICENLEHSENSETGEVDSLE